MGCAGRVRSGRIELREVTMGNYESAVLLLYGRRTEAQRHPVVVGAPTVAPLSPTKSRADRDDTAETARSEVNRTVTARRGGKQSMCAFVKQWRGMQNARGAHRVANVDAI